jgi:hypothetical protein
MEQVLWWENNVALVLLNGAYTVSWSIFLDNVQSCVKTLAPCGIMISDNWFQGGERLLSFAAGARGWVARNLLAQAGLETLLLEDPDSLAVRLNTLNDTGDLDFRLQLTREPWFYVQDNNILEGAQRNPDVAAVCSVPDQQLDFRYNFWNTASQSTIESHFLLTGENLQPRVFPFPTARIDSAGPGGFYPY